MNKFNKKYEWVGDVDTYKEPPMHLILEVVVQELDFHSLVQEQMLLPL